MPECAKQWRIDVNDKYQQAVGVVTSLATGSMILPVLFLKDVAGATAHGSIAALLNGWAYAGWGCLAAAALGAIGYYYCSAKWVKLSWGQPTDMFGHPVEDPFVERCLDVTYFLMMSGFVSGLTLMVVFMVRFTTPAGSPPP
jgi:hypothetical protein